MESVDRVDEILNSLKAFYTYLGQVLDKGYNNDINDLEYLHEIVDTFYSSGELPEDEPDNSETEDETNNGILEEYDPDHISNHFTPGGEYVALSDSESDNLSISSSDIEFIESTTIPPKQKVSTSFIDDFYSNKLTSENILIFSKNKDHKNIFNKRLNNSFIY